MTNTANAQTCQAWVPTYAGYCNAPAVGIFMGFGYCREHNPDPLEPFFHADQRAAAKAKREQERTDMAADLRRNRAIAAQEKAVAGAALRMYDIRRARGYESMSEEVELKKQTAMLAALLAEKREAI